MSSCFAGFNYIRGLNTLIITLISPGIISTIRGLSDFRPGSRPLPANPRRVGSGINHLPGAGLSTVQLT